MVRAVSATMMRPRRVGEILDGAIKIYLANAWTLIGLAAVVIIPVQTLYGLVFVSTFNGGAHPDNKALLGADIVLPILASIAGSLVTAAAVKAVSDAYLDQPTGIAISLRFAVRRLLGVVGLEILVVIGLIFAFLLLIIPGIWLYGLWSVAMPALLVERLRPWRALGRSRRLVRGRWWPTAAVLLVASVMVFVISGVLSGLLSAIVGLPRPGNVNVTPFVIGSTITGAISSVLTTPFRAAVVTLLYYDLRIRRDGFDLQLLADQLGLPSGSLAEAEPEPVAWGADPVPLGPESVGQPGGPPFWPPPPGWRPTQ